MTAKWSWISALQDGTLSELQVETLQTLVEDGEANSLVEAARLLDDQLAIEAGRSGDALLRDF